MLGVAKRVFLVPCIVRHLLSVCRGSVAAQVSDIQVECPRQPSAVTSTLCMYTHSTERGIICTQNTRNVDNLGAAAMEASGANGAGAVKESATQQAQGAGCEYCHIKLVAALKLKGALMFAPSAHVEDDGALSAVASELDEGFGLVDEPTPGTLPLDPPSQQLVGGSL